MNRRYPGDVERVVQVEVLFDLLDVLVLVAGCWVQGSGPADDVADDRKVELHSFAELRLDFFLLDEFAEKSVKLLGDEFGGLLVVRAAY